jgi:LacI family gluconate utilization system Gnt-I transcriptional repressor
MTKVATLKDIASRVGVSLNTVSRSLRAPQTVRPEMRARIKIALEELNYVPNRLAGGLAGSDTSVVGVIVTSLHYSEFATIIEAMQMRLAEAGLQLMIGNTRYEPEEELALVRALLSWRPAAIVIVGTDHHPRARELLATSGHCVVEIWDCVDPVIDSGVGMDHRAIGAMQVDHLYEQGCRRLAFTGSLRPHDQRAHKRLAGARARVRQRKLSALLIATEPAIGVPEMGDRLVQKILAGDPAIDGIICNGDIVAHGVLRGLKAARRRIPDDVAVIGFGDNPSNSCLNPPLTSINPPRVAIGQKTADLILKRIAGGPAECILLPPELIVRQSTQRKHERQRAQAK